jgi:subtilisin-like proprotein convertase family protein
MSPYPPTRRRVTVFAVLLCMIAASLLWLTLGESRRPPRASAADAIFQAGLPPSDRNENTAPAAPRIDSEETWEIDPTGDKRSIALALDEAVLRDADGKETVVRLVPPATRESLPGRLAELSAPGGVFPVAYWVGEDRSVTSRRLITADLRVQLDAAAAEKVAMANQLIIKDRPAYAPDWVIMSARNPIAALDAVSKLRAVRDVASADILLAVQHSLRTLPNDSLISSQWHLKHSSTAVAGSDVNIESVWNYPATGVRGKGVWIGVVDDGLQTDHPDLSANVDTVDDKDWNGLDADPSPSVGDDHGTACAGNAAARGNNGLGVSGTAPEATLVGMRLIAAAVTDSQEAEAMTYLPDLIQIKTNSWGPVDTGKVLEGPGPLTMAALQSAATTGRGGKGSIILWAGGNGGDVGDNSNYDGYANSIYTIAIGATDSLGRRAYYSEPGSNIVVCAPSSGGAGTLGITTVDRSGIDGYNSGSTPGELMNADYTQTFGGTSSVAPTAAGVVALMLEKNPALGSRDVQEILIRTAAHPPSSTGWVTNAAGISFNYDFGAGLINATAAVNLAAAWNNLPVQVSTTSTQSTLSVAVPNNDPVGITRSFDLTASDLRVEQVTLKLSASHTARGNLAITLTSPTGMISNLAEVHADTNNNYSNWIFSTVRHWGEKSTGIWTLKIADLSTSGNTAGGTLTAVELKVFGSPIDLRPSITAATLSASGQSYADVPLRVAAITAIDPVGRALTYSYQWQSSSDAIFFSEVPGATLVAAPALVGKLVRCQITASNGASSSQSFTTAAVNLLARPAAVAQIGSVYSYTSGLVLAGTKSQLSRRAIINEFSQGPAGGSAEWIEILTLQTGSLANWNLHNAAGNVLAFLDAPAWGNITAGTFIVIYNGNSKDPLLPADDLDPTDGRMVISSTNPAFFNAARDSWPLLMDNGDSVTLADATAAPVHAISYGGNTSVIPHVGDVGSARSASFIGDTEAGADLAANWAVTSALTSGINLLRAVTPLPLVFGGPWSPLPTGFVGKGLGTPYTSNLGGDTSGGSAKFDTTGDYLTIALPTQAAAFSYHLKGNPGSGFTTSVGTFLVQESPDGINFSTLHSMVNQDVDTAFSDIPIAATRFIRFIYQVKSSGNIQLDKLAISAANTVIGVTPGLANSSNNQTFVTALRNGSLSGAALFRVGSTARIPTGLNLDPVTGVLGGNIASSNLAGDYLIVIERYNALGESAAQSYTLTLSASPANTYAAWIANYNVGILNGFADDADHDGLPNGIENYLGTRPDIASSGFSQVSATASTLIFRHSRSNTTAADLTPRYEWSTDLVHWQPSAATNGNIMVTITTSVLIEANAPTNDLVEVTATVTGTPEHQLFVRLKTNP